MQAIPLQDRHGAITGQALVDDQDAERVKAAGPWRRHPKGYAHRSDGARGSVLMHRFVLGLVPGDPGVDHRNRDPLDNQRANLRRATAAQNAQNQRSRSGTSTARGVSFDRERNKWRAQVRLNGVLIFLGRYESEEDAARASATFRRERMPFSEADRG